MPCNQRCPFIHSTSSILLSCFHKCTSLLDVATDNTSPHIFSWQNRHSKWITLIISPALISSNLFPLFFLDYKAEQLELPITQQYYQNGFGQLKMLQQVQVKLLLHAPPLLNHQNVFFHENWLNHSIYLHQIHSHNYILPCKTIKVVNCNGHQVFLGCKLFVLSAC